MVVAALMCLYIHLWHFLRAKAVGVARHQLMALTATKFSFKSARRAFLVQFWAAAKWFGRPALIA